MEADTHTQSRVIGLGIKIALLSANILVLWLFAPLPVLLYTGLGLSAVGLFFIITGTVQVAIQSKGKKRAMTFQRFRDSMAFSKSYMRLNLRYTVLTAIGLMIAIATLSQGFIVSQGIQQDYIFSKTDPNTMPTITVTTTIAGYADYSMPNPENKTLTILNTISTYVHDISSNYGFRSPEKEYSVIKITGFSLLINNKLHYVTMLGISPDTARAIWGQEIAETLPNSPGSFAALLFGSVLSSYPNISTNNPQLLSYSYTGKDQNDQPLTSTLRVNASITQLFKLSNDVSVRLPFELGFAGSITFLFDISKIDGYRAWLNYIPSGLVIQAFFHPWKAISPIDTSERLNDMAKDIQLNRNLILFDEPYYKITRATSPVGGIIISLQSFLSAVQFIMFLFIVPIIGGALFLALYSFGLIETRKRRFVAIIKSRGASSAQVATALSLEVITSAVLGFATGLLFSIASTPFVVGFLDLQVAGGAFSLFWDTRDTMLKIAAFSVLIAFDLNISEILYLSPLTVSEAEEPEEKEVTGWKKYYFDLFLLLVGILMTLILEMLKNREASEVQTILMLAVSPIALLGISIGSVLTVSRYFSPIAKSIGDWGWKRIGNITFFSLKNLNLRKESSSGLASLLLLTSLIGVFLVAVPFSLGVGAQEQLYYQLGGEINLSQLYQWNGTDMSFLSEVEGIKAMTNVFLIEFDIFTASSTIEQNVRILGINTTTFLQAAYLKQEFLNFPMNSIPDRLTMEPNTTKKFPAFIWSADAREKVVDEDSSITFSFSDKNQPLLRHDYIFDIQGFFDYWPLLVPSNNLRSGYRLVVPLDAIYSLLEILFTNQVKVREPMVIANVADSYDRVDVANAMLSAASKIATTPRVETISTTTENQASQAVLATVPLIVRLGYIAIILQALIGVGMFASLTISMRKREIGLYKALGMTRAQLGKIFLTEILYVLLFSMTLGLAFGLFTARSLMIVISLPGLGGALPPYQPFIPIPRILELLGTLVTGGLIAAIYPAYQLAAQKSGEIMKVE